MAVASMKMKHDVDPAQKVIDGVGDLSKFHLMSNRVLLGIYERPKTTQSGVWLPDVTRKEDEYQGKALVVLLKGNKAFVSDDQYDFGDDNVDIGDFVCCWVSDGRKIKINGQLCRVVRDQDIVMKIPAPDAIY